MRYDEFAVGPARRRSACARRRRRAPATDLTLRLSQVDINVPLDADVFQVDVPTDATPLTLDELRRAGPLGGGGRRPRGRQRDCERARR